MTKATAERVVLVGVITLHQTEAQAAEYLDELAFLAATSGAVTLGRFVQRIDRPHPKTYVGSGKIEEIRLFCLQHRIDTAIFDDELSPSQLRNIERALQVKLLDRNHLILDIFAKRARTADAKTQVALAQYQYLLPRLTRLWTHLDRTKGGIGMRGPGETQIETDRRIIQQKIARLKQQLVKIDRQKTVQRSHREQWVRVALVGYTNVGKSTLMNLLSQAGVFAEDKLFATLDTTVRKVVIDGLPFLLSDTVGFIRKLPHQLIESFKSTLDEVREADLLIHVLDISHPRFEEHFEVVNATIAAIDPHQEEKPRLVVFNKVDAYQVDQTTVGFHPQGASVALEQLKRSWMAQLGGERCVFISAREHRHIDVFKRRLFEQVSTLFRKRYPHHYLSQRTPS